MEHSPEPYIRPDNLIEALGLGGAPVLNEEERAMKKLLIEEYKKQGKVLIEEVRKIRTEYSTMTPGDAIRELYGQIEKGE